MRRRLHEPGLRARRHFQLPLLIREYRIVCTEWANDHRLWTAADWRNCLLTDELRYPLHQSGVEFLFILNGFIIPPIIIPFVQQFESDFFFVNDNIQPDRGREKFGVTKSWHCRCNRPYVHQNAIQLNTYGISLQIRWSMQYNAIVILFLK